MNPGLYLVVVCAAVLATCVSGTESAAILAAAPASFVTAHSSQVVARNYNGFAAPLITAPVVVPAPVAPVAPIPARFTGPLVAYDPYLV